MQLSLQHRQVGDVAVVTCSGRLVAGAEADALLTQIDDLLPLHSRILLHLGDIDYIDSGGLGLLVRCLTRVQNASGQLSLCALSPKVSEVLRITRLDGPLRPYIAEADAIALVHDEPPTRRCVRPADPVCRHVTRRARVSSRAPEAGRPSRRHVAESLRRSDTAEDDAAVGRRDWRGAAGHARDEFRRRVPPPGATTGSHRASTIVLVGRCR